MNDYKITFSPDTILTAVEFAESWNSLESCREVAEAKTESATQSDFALAEMAMMVSLGFIGNIAAEVLKDLVKDAVKDAIAKYIKKTPQAANPPLPAPDAIEIQQIEQPDGTKLLVVVINK
jgi:hypothetical protein